MRSHGAFLGLSRPAPNGRSPSVARLTSVRSPVALRLRLAADLPLSGAGLLVWTVPVIDRTRSGLKRIEDDQHFVDLRGPGVVLGDGTPRAGQGLRILRQCALQSGEEGVR